jgi:SAM-dependent methyltransferase
MHNVSTLKMRDFLVNWVVPLMSSQDKIKVLDVGSYDFNGSYHQLFVDKIFEYTGLDIEPGKNVNMVVRDPYDWSAIPNDSFDVVISGQSFEHIEFFWLTVMEMVRVLRKGGLLCIIAPQAYVEHRYPVDCWRFNTDGLLALAKYTSLEVIGIDSYVSAEKEGNRDCILIASKTYEGTDELYKIHNKK